MEAYETEEQQWEAIKRFFKKYGNTLLWIAIIVMGSISAVRYFQHHKQNQRIEASETYSELLMAVEQKDATAVNTKAQHLKNKHARSEYSVLASMITGKMAFKDGDFDAAIQQFQWAANNSSNSELKRLAQYRLMKTYMSQGQYDKALDIANKDVNGLMPLFKELEGDVHVQKSEYKLAKKAYKAAFDASKGNVSPLLKLKLDNLGIEADHE